MNKFLAAVSLCLAGVLSAAQPPGNNCYVARDKAHAGTPVIAREQGTVPPDAPTVELAGVMVWSDSWLSQGGGELQCGLYDFSDASLDPVLHFQVDNDALTGVCVDGSYYLVSRKVEEDQSIAKIAWLRYDAITGELINEVLIPSPSYSKLPLVMTYDEQTGITYALTYSNDNSSSVLATVNLATGLMRTVGEIGKVGEVPSFLTLSAIGNGMIYGIASDGNLYSIDAATAGISLIGSTGLSPMYIQSAAYDRDENCIWWAASLSDDTSRLCRIDVQDGSVTTVGNFVTNEEIVGLYVKDRISNPDAPARLRDLVFTPSQPGSTSGNLTMTLSSVSEAGNALSGTVDVSVSVDGAEAAKASGAAGTSVSVPLTLQNGQHTITAFPSVGTNIGKESVLSVWTGLDAPAQISDIHLVISGGTIAELTWSASNGGAHGGYCPNERLRYRIVRNDGKICSEAFQGTLYTETLPEEISQYYYTVTPYITDGPEGISTVSETKKGGLYYLAPVNFDFNSDIDFASEFVVVDNNKDYSTWIHSYTWDENVAAVAYNYSYSNSADDYLFFPAIKFDSNTVYEISFEHSKGYGTENLKLVAATDARADAVIQTLADWQDIIADGTTVKKLSFTLPETGARNLAFYIYSPAGQSFFTIDNVSIRPLGNIQAPESPGLTLATVSENNRDCVKVSVIIPSKNIGGSALDGLSSVSIYRGEAVDPVHVFSSPVQGETMEWIDTEPGNGPVKYRVVATNSYGDSPYVTEEIFVNGILPPYSASFATDPVTEYFTVLDVNDDGSTWKFVNGSAVYEYNLFNPADDWIFTPMFALDAERVYKVNTRLRTNEWVGKPESLSITYGTDVLPENRDVLLDIPELLEPAGGDRNMYLAVPVSGRYNIGLHAYSQKNLLQIYIDALSIVDAASVHAPAAPSGLTVTADPGGLLKATVSFVVPATTYNGEPVGEITEVEILRGTEVVHHITNVVPGQMSWIDNDAPEGETTYSVRAVNSYGTGVEATASAYIGHDVPSAVSELRANGIASNSNAELSWKAPVTGVHGGYIDPASLNYTVTRTVDYTPVEIASAISGTSLTDDMSETGEQKVVTYTVTVASDKGNGETLSVNISLGKLHSLPLEENFASWFSSEWINTVLTNFNGSWSIMNEQNGVNSVDEGSGFLSYHKWDDNSDLSAGYVATPKISLDGAANPVLSLWFRHDPADNANQCLHVGYRIDDGDFAELAELHVNSAEEGWKQYSWPIANDGEYVSVELHAESYDNTGYMYIDNIVIDDILEHNLCVKDFTGVSEIGPGGATFSVQVINKGLADAGEYSVVFLRDGQELSSKSSDGLAIGETAVFDFEAVGPTAVECGDTHIYQARVDYSQDENTQDNLSNEISARFIESLYPAVRNLVATASGQDITLEWSPADAFWYPAFTDEFENYESFAINGLDPWTLYDGDGQRTVGIRYGLSFPDWYTPKAWQVWDPTRAGLYGEDVLAHSGLLCLMSMSSDGTIPDADSTTPENDDWLISEEIAGGTALSFWLKQPTNNYGNETAEVLWSSTDRDPASFSHLADITLDEMAVWSRHYFMLPADARYFAIRHNSACFGLWLDDVSYSPVRAKEDLSFNGYNVYRDGQFLDVAATETFVDTNVAEGIHTYMVAARYELGEGTASEPVEIDFRPSGISGISVGTDPAIYVDGGSIVIDAPQRCNVLITSPDGSTIGIFIAEGCVRKDVGPGMYIVRAGSVTRKLIVK